MVVDTGLGQKNGATVMRMQQKLAKGPILYFTTTHYHSEHTTGEQAFPANTIIIRNKAQQDEMDKGVAGHIEVFKKMSAQNLDLLQDVKFRPPDVVYDRESRVDLGGVTARLFWLGPAHTKGDELIFVEEDSVLIPGDIVQKDIFPIMPNPDASVKGWLSILDSVEACIRSLSFRTMARLSSTLRKCDAARVSAGPSIALAGTEKAGSFR